MNPCISVYGRDMTNVVSIAQQSRFPNAPKLVFEYKRGFGPNTQVDHTDGRTTILFQRGFLPQRRATSRTLDWTRVFSGFKIRYGSVVVSVPFHAFLAVPSPGFGMKIPACRKCGSSGCHVCMGEFLCTRSVFLLESFDKQGFSYCRLYVAFEDMRGLLTRVPEQFADALIQRATDGHCVCGKCKHPLKRYRVMTADRGARSFERACVRLFSAEHKLVENAAARDSDALFGEPGASARLPPDVEALFCKRAPCGICFEENCAVGPACGHEKCNIDVCRTCHFKLRGMCPICDRSKLYGAISFFCTSCKSAYPCSEFGFECIDCQCPRLCSDCYESYGICSQCCTDRLFPPPGASEL